MSGFSIIGSSGSLLRGEAWNPTSNESIEVGINERRRTFLDHTSDKVTYLIANGTTPDFSTLSPGHGFPVGPHTGLWFRSRIWHSAAANTKIVIIEFDSYRRRIGEVTVIANNDAWVTFRPETRYALFSLRIKGKGRIAFSELQAHLDETIADDTAPGVEHFKLHSLVREKSVDKQDLRAQIAGIEDAARNLGHQLASAPNTQDFLAESLSEANTDARNNGKVSSSREHFLRQLLVEMASSLPDSNGSHHFERLDLSIAIIADESMFNFYKDSCREVHYLSPTNYQEILRSHSLDAIVYVTSWKGLYSDEWKGLKFRDAPKQALESILHHAQSEQIPTIFQSIEDPSNFEYFLPLARKFDHVFTSDISCLEQYRLELGHSRVYYGEYGVNPFINNPVGSFRHDIPRAVFSGSYPERYPERTEDMQTIFDSIPDSESSLTIVDRNFNSSDFHFPARYQESVIGAFPHDKLQKIHKLFRYSINFNSIKDSPTMCAMRVYELQAQGKPMISNYARSVFNRFPEIRIIPHTTTFRELGREEPELSDLVFAQQALARIMCQKTSFQVVGDLFEAIGLKNIRRSRSSLILVVATGDIDAVSRTVARQKHVETHVISENEFNSARHNLSDYGYLGVMSSDIEYGDYYLAGRLSAFIYTDSSFVTQKAHYVASGYSSGPIHEYIATAEDRELTLVPTDNTEGIDFVTGAINQLKGRGYAVDPYQVSFKTHLKQEFAGGENRPSRLTIVIPVFNNGEYLLTKCLASIQRHTNWDSFDILLVDDGSTDEETTIVCDDLVSIYRNVRYIRYGDGGSGSASRPRNRGIREATTEFITFLDPDNEISDNGYNYLLNTYDELLQAGSDVDFVAGYQVKVTSRSRVNGLHTDKPVRLVSNPIREFFEDGRFPVVSTQAAIIKTRFLQEKSLDFVENAAGQDTLFGWEVLANAHKAAFSNEAHIIYYAERDGSVTNEVDSAYFAKNLTLEKEQVPRLESLGILELYKQHHFDQFYENWYLERLSKVNLTERVESRKYLARIANLYGCTLEELEAQSTHKEGM